MPEQPLREVAKSLGEHEPARVVELVPDGVERFGERVGQLSEGPRDAPRAYQLVPSVTQVAVTLLWHE